MIRSVAEQAARAGGQVLRERLYTPRVIQPKGTRDMVTDADLAAQSAILDIIRQHFPEHGILSEEKPALNADSPWVWMIDPLDGTTNYTHHLPCFAVSIALVERGEPIVGVVLDPLRDQLFTAERGAGAHLNGRALHVNPRARLEHAVVGLDWAHDLDVRRRVLVNLTRVAPVAGTLRVGGSAALGLCYVAAGWLDAYFHLQLQPWDEAAGGLIVREAGGMINGPAGAEWTCTAPACLASNGRIHADLLDLIEWP